MDNTDADMIVSDAPMTSSSPLAELSLVSAQIEVARRLLMLAHKLIEHGKPSQALQADTRFFGWSFSGDMVVELGWAQTWRTVLECILDYQRRVNQISKSDLTFEEVMFPGLRSSLRMRTSMIADVEEKGLITPGKTLQWDERGSSES